MTVDGRLTASAAGVAVIANLLIAWLLHPAATDDNLNVRAALIHVIGYVFKPLSLNLNPGPNP